MNFSRRQMLSGLALVASGVAGSALLSACSSAAPASPTAAPAAPAPAAPAAPAAPTATTAAQAAAPAPTATAAAAAATPTAAPAVAPTATAAAQAAPAAAGNTTVELWYIHPEWKDGMAAVVKKFQVKNPKIVVNVVGKVSSDYQNLIQTALNAGIGPDLFQHNSLPQLDVDSKDSSKNNFPISRLGTMRPTVS